MSYIEIFAVLFSLVCVILTIKNNILSWPIGIIGVVFYMILFSQEKLYGNLFLQFLFIGQSIWGWINWSKSNKFPIKWVSTNNKMYMLWLTFTLLIFIITILSEVNSSMIYLDAFTTTFSIVGTLLLSYRKIDAWIYWILADVIFIYMFIENGLYLSAIIYFIFLILSTIGLYRWIKYVH